MRFLATLWVLIMVFAYALYFLLDESRIFSPFAGIAMGILLSKVPKIKLMDNNQWLPMTLAVIFMLMCVFCAYLPKIDFYIDWLMIFVLFPVFLYMCLHYYFCFVYGLFES